MAALREEIARLKRVKGRSVIKPSGLDKLAGRQPRGHAKWPGRGKVIPRVAIETQEVRVEPPPGSQRKGYETYQIQELEIRARVVRYRRERWLTPDGETIVAPLPANIHGHFGPELRRYVLMQYHQGQVTVERLVAQLQAIGIAISKREVMRLLIDNQDEFLDENRDVLRAGLETAPWITADDTGARHRGANAVCTEIGNDNFTWFATTASKSRVNFLGLLRAGFTDFVVNDAALTYMREHTLAGAVVKVLAGQRQCAFADQAAWQRHLRRLRVNGRPLNAAQVRIATEGALWGAVREHGFLRDAVIISDDAGQFNVGLHALCWVHSERQVHRLETFTDAQRAAQKHERGLIWRFYAALKAYRLAPSARRGRQLRARFDRIFQRTTGFATLDRLLKRLHANKAELLRVLGRPDIPLNTNRTETDLRCQVTKRQVSGGTH
ncbi:MAG TPA: transposase, partial [Casimicrobiaceae bacterium]